MTDNFTGETRTIHTPTYEGTIPGPTLEVRPGDTLAINLINDLPPNDPNERAGHFPHDFHTLNLHTHGLTVSPLGISDNVFRMMEPGTTNAIKIDIPRDHPTGTFWYHPHVHGTVTYQFVSGMAGFLIVKGGPGTLDDVPEVKAAKDVVMGFQVIRTGLDGNVPFVNEQATLFGTFPPSASDPSLQGLWSTFGIDGAPGRSFYYFTNNGVTNPTLHMRPGEVQRWRLLDASQGENLLLSLQGHDLSVVAMDGITAPKMVTVPSGTPLVMGPGQRYDVLIKAGAPGTYQLQAMDPAMSASVTPSGIDPQTRNSRMSFDFPSPCSTNPLSPQAAPSCAGQFTYPFPLATIVVDGDPVDMQLPTGPLPVPKGLPSMDTMLNTTPTAERHLAFEICGEVMTSPSFVIAMGVPEERPPSCGWYFAKYDATYWGGTPFRSLEMLRDDDDKGVPNNDPNEPLVNFVKDGLFNPDQPLFDDMIAGTYEEWTVLNRSFSDHPFHIHQNHFLLTKINGKPLPTPEWHDTVIVPASQPQPNNASPNVNINAIPPGSITFRIYFNPVTVGCFVVHCHTLTHEDLGMMQRLDILPGPGQPNQCEIQAMSHTERSRLAAIDKARIGGTFTLVNATGKPVTDRDFLNKYLLVYFGYTYCPDNCPITLMTLTQALDKLGPKAERIQPVFITVDPKRDTPSVIGQYTAAFSPRLIGLTGSVEQIAATEKEYRVYVAKQRTGPGPNDYAIEHSSIIYLIGPDGRFIAPVRADQDGTAMATEIASYLR